MEQEFFEKVFTALEKDDVQAIDDLRQEGNPGSVRFGRFPFLSVAYLLSAKKIAKKYENDFIKINTFIDAPEPFGLSASFRKKAGKATRLFLDEFVSPVEMLTILGETKKATELYPIARPTVAQKDRIEKIYSLQYNSSLVYQGNEVIFDKKPLSHAQKKRILIAAISSFLCVALCACTPFVVNAFVPFIGVGTETEADRPDQTTTNPEQGNTVPEQQITDPENGNSNPEQGEVVPDNPGSGTEEPQQEEKKEVTNFVTVSSFEEVNLSAADTRYTLSENVVLPDCSDKVLECELDCAGHTLTATAFPLFGNIKGSLENVTFTASGDREINESTAFLAKNNEGTVKKVSLSLSGTFTVNATLSEEGGETTIAGLLMENVGNVEECTVALDLILQGLTTSNASFAGLVTLNKGNILSCSATGSVEADTCDLAGVCETNAYLIKDVTSSVNLTQTTAIDEWSPIAAGIAINNYGSLSGCANAGNVVILATFEKEELSEKITLARASGVVISSSYSSSYGYIPSVSSCSNTGNVSVSAKQKYAYAAGIVMSSTYSSTSMFSYKASLSSLKNEGDVSAKSEKLSAYAAGICVILGSADHSVLLCENTGSVTAEGTTPASPSYCEVLCGGLFGFTRNESQSFFSSNTTIAQCSNTGKASAALKNTPTVSFTVLSAGVLAFSARYTYISACQNDGEIEAVYDGNDQVSETELSSRLNAAGISADSSSSTIVSCINTGRVSVRGTSCSSDVGGIIGSGSNASVSSCKNEGEIAVGQGNKTACVGGIAGVCNAVSGCLNIGRVSLSDRLSTSSVGGIAGKATGNVNDCENKAIVTVTSAGTTYVGGILGETTNAIYICKNSADITVTANGTNYVGGTVGNSTSTLSRCVCLANVTVNGNEESLSYVGGICGQTTYMVEYSYLEGELSVTSGAAFVGGILGNYAQINYNGKIDHSITKGSIVVTVSGENKSYVGGICGYLEEKLYYEGKENEQYYGGKTLNSFMLGTIVTAGENAIAGSIVGGCEKNGTGKEGETTLDGNAYTPSLRAIGAYIHGETITDGDNLGSKQDLANAITESETYKTIIETIASLLGIEPEQEDPTDPVDPEPETPDPEEQEEPGSGNILT